MSEISEMNCKACKACKVVKPLTEYHKQSRAKDGRKTRCKKCSNTSRRKHKALELSPEELHEDKWKSLEEYPNCKISSDGYFMHKNGEYVHIERVSARNKDGKEKQPLTHRLVAECFIPNPNNFKQIDFIDGNKENRKAENLKWVKCAKEVRESHEKLRVKKTIYKYHQEVRFESIKPEPLKVFDYLDEAVQDQIDKHDNNRPRNVIKLNIRRSLNTINNHGQAYDYHYTYVNYKNTTK